MRSDDTTSDPDDEALPDDDEILEIMSRHVAGEYHDIMREAIDECRRAIDSGRRPPEQMCADGAVIGANMWSKPLVGAILRGEENDPLPLMREARLYALGGAAQELGVPGAPEFAQLREWADEPMPCSDEMRERIVGEARQSRPADLAEYVRITDMVFELAQASHRLSEQENRERYEPLRERARAYAMRTLPDVIRNEAIGIAPEQRNDEWSDPLRGLGDARQWALAAAQLALAADITDESRLGRCARVVLEPDSAIMTWTRHH